MRMRMRRAGEERGYRGSAWVCCWLLGWQAAALQLPPCEEVRFSSSGDFLIQRGGREGDAPARAEGGIPGWGVARCCCSPRTVRGMTEGSDPRKRTLRRGPAGALRGGRVPPTPYTIRVRSDCRSRSYFPPLVSLLLPPVRENSAIKGDSTGLAAFLNTVLNQCKRRRVRGGGWGGGVTELSRPLCVSPGCPRLRRQCDMGRETFRLSPAIKTRNERDLVSSEQGPLCGAVGAGAEAAGQGCLNPGWPRRRPDGEDQG